MNREEELKAQQEFIAAGKHTVCKPFTSWHVYQKLKRERRSWCYKNKKGSLLQIIRKNNLVKP